MVVELKAVFVNRPRTRYAAHTLNGIDPCSHLRPQMTHGHTIIHAWPAHTKTTGTSKQCHMLGHNSS